MRLIRIEYQYTHCINDNDGDFLYKEVRKREIRIIVQDSHDTTMAEFYCDNMGGNSRDEAYKRLSTTDDGYIDVMLPSPQYRI